VILWLVVRGVAWDDVVTAIRPAGSGWLLAALAANALVLPLWAATWSLLAGLLGSASPSWRTLLPIAATASTIMNTVPYGAGHAAAAAMLAHRSGGGLGVRGAAALLLADQAVEGMVKLLVLGLAIGVGPVPPALRRTAVLLAGAIAGAALVALLLWRHGRWPARWSARWVARWGSRIAPLGARPAQPSARIHRPGAALGGALLLAIASKAAEAAAIACVWRAYDAPLPWAALPAALGTTLVAGMLPITPANVGPYEAATSMLYQWLGMAKTPALVLTLVQHAAFLVPTVGGGALLLLAGGPLKPATTAASDAPQRESAAAAWGILLATFAAYALVPAVHEALAQGPVRFRDDLVQRWELALFGGHPARTLAAQLPGAVVRELFQLAYLAYYPLVVLPLAWLWHRERHDAFRRTHAAVIATFVACYTLYLLMPVRGPRYLWATPAAAHSGPVAALVQGILARGSSAGTAFPSLHAGVAVTLAIMAWRTRALPAVPLALLAASLSVGAIAGGYHYAVDILAGAITGIVASLLVDRTAPRSATPLRG
jgi:uncharacterized membrane protein YbhN (UPF0104 family)